MCTGTWNYLHLLLYMQNNKIYSEMLLESKYLAADPVESSPSQHQRYLSAWPPGHQAPWHRLYSSHMLSSQTLQSHTHRYWETKKCTKIMIHYLKSLTHRYLPANEISLLQYFDEHKRFPLLAVATYPPGTRSGRPLLTQLAPQPVQSPHTVQTIHWSSFHLCMPGWHIMLFSSFSSSSSSKSSSMAVAMFSTPNAAQTI